jgi:hypothetical protein
VNEFKLRLYDSRINVNEMNGLYVVWGNLFLESETDYENDDDDDEYDIVLFGSNETKLDFILYVYEIVVGAAKEVFVGLVLI